MSLRGLVVALLCGLLGLGGGALVAYVAQGHPTASGRPEPVSAVSPSVPIDEPSSSASSYNPPIGYPALQPGFVLNQIHTMSNDLATWTYHVPDGWVPYAECPPAPATCKIPTGTVLKPQQVDKQQIVDWRPAGEPKIGGYLLRVAVLNNTLFNVGQTRTTKIEGFRQQRQNTGEDFSVIRTSPSAVYFTYRALPENWLRYNFFQWFAADGRMNATLEMSVAGRPRDAPGLYWLFDRFADNANGVPAKGA